MLNHCYTDDSKTVSNFNTLSSTCSQISNYSRSTRTSPVKTSPLDNIKIKINDLSNKIAQIKLRQQQDKRDKLYSSNITSPLRKTTNFHNYLSNNANSKKQQNLSLNTCRQLIKKAQNSIKKTSQMTLKTKEVTQKHIKKLNETNNDTKSIIGNLTQSKHKKKQQENKMNHTICRSVSVKIFQQVCFKIYKDSQQGGLQQNQINQEVQQKQKVQGFRAVQEQRVKVDPSRISNGYIYGKLLGKGRFGQVYLSQHISTGFLVAIKRVNKDKLRQYNMVDRFIQEVKLHRSLDHPHIVKCYDLFQEKDNICLVLEYLNGGTLFDFINEVYTIPAPVAVTILAEVIDALCYIHQKNIIHRDIKPQNIVLTSTGIAKLCDFGWSTMTEEPRTTFCGTLQYASPQMVQRQQYNESIDVWCIGVLTYEMLLGRAPFENNNRLAVMQGIVNVEQNGIPGIEKLPQQARQFIEDVLHKDSSLRPNMFQLKSYQFFTKNLQLARKSRFPSSFL